MNFSKSQFAILIFTALYTIVFAVFYIGQLNMEFIGYVGVIVFIFALLYATLDKTLSPLISWLGCLCGA